MTFRFRAVDSLALVFLLFSVARVCAAHSFSALPALAQASSWLNTERALTADDLRGRLVLVDFWTASNVHCQQAQSDLKTLESEFGHELTVVGVASAKFDDQKSDEALRATVERLDISHPVANDRDLKVGGAFAVTGVPTFVLVDPSGEVLQRYTGDGHLAEIRHEIANYFTQHPKPAGRAALTELPLALEKNREKTGALRFPGKVLWTMHQGKPFLFISDSGHHRLLGVQLVGTNLGEVRYRIGREGEAGDADGDFNTARFRAPQGLAYDGGTLFVADTGNHRLRAIDLAKQKVTTLAGNGQVGATPAGTEFGALITPLSSPWDLALLPGKRRLAIALAGSQQIWTYDRDQNTLSVLAGNGTESIDDGAYPDNTLAQPSGLAALGDKLYFVDAETSSLRVWEGGRVSTLLGTGLFDFGFRDGIAGRALMQHPLGVYADKDGVYVADTFNHSLRRWDPVSAKLETVAGGARRGFAVSGSFVQARFNEPGGISGTKNLLYVADTGNGLVQVLDRKEKRVEPLYLNEMPSEERVISAVRQVSEALPRLRTAATTEVTSQKAVAVHLELEPGWKLSAPAPSWLAIFMNDAKGSMLVKEYGRKDLQRAEVKLPPLVENATYRLQGTFYFCEKSANALCVLQSFDQTFKAIGSDDARSKADLPIALQR